MGSSGAKLTAFQSSIFPSGLDLNRSEILRAKGTWKAATSASFRAGQAVMLNASNEVIISDATAVLGIAKWSKVTLGVSVNVDEPLVMTGTTAQNLKRGNVSNVSVRSAVDQGGTAYTDTTHYTVNTTNGTVTRVAGGGGFITDGQTVYVTYTYSLTEADYEFEGKNFWQSNDWVTVQDGRITVIEAPADIFTTEYDTSRTYALTGAAGSTLYINSSGIFTNSSSGAKLVGHVIQLPSAGDPYLGVRFIGQIVANT